MIRSFGAIVGSKPRVLILGTMPGAESLRKREYYAYRHNQFWKIIYAVFGGKTSDKYTDKVKYLKRNKIALWDVLGKCRRENSSSDSEIREEIPNKIPELLKAHPSIKRVFFNGRPAETFFKKHFKGPFAQKLRVLPSTSPANASYTFSEKLKRWKKVKEVKNGK